MTRVACKLQRIRRMLRNDLYILIPKKKTHQTFTRNSPTTDFRAIFLYNQKWFTS